MAGNIIEVRDLKKTYPGGVEAVRGVSFDVKEGEFFGFLGPNGAGKTTTINMLVNLVKRTSGHVNIAGFDLAMPGDYRLMQGEGASEQFAAALVKPGLVTAAGLAAAPEVPGRGVSYAPSLARFL